MSTDLGRSYRDNGRGTAGGSTERGGEKDMRKTKTAMGALREEAFGRIVRGMENKSKG